jgi:hypothetical protein
MHNWYASGAVISTMGLFAACASTSPRPIVDTEAPPKTVMATPEPVEIAPTPIDEPQQNIEEQRPEDSTDEHDGLVEGGVVGGVVGGIAGVCRPE